MKRFNAEIDIEAPPEAVWSALVDTASWPAFDPYSERIEGRPALGETITVYSTMAPGRPFPVEITASSVRRGSNGRMACRRGRSRASAPTRSLRAERAAASS